MSPIKGLSNQRRMPRLGKIHLGIKVTNANGVTYPKAVDYFVCPPEVQAVFGEKPKELEIMFPVEDDTIFAPQYYKYYSASYGLICKGDGENCARLTDLANGMVANKDSKETTWTTHACPGRECQLYKSKKCQEVMCLQFMIPQVPGLGIWQLDTGSYFGIVEINSGIDLIRTVCGRVSGIPLKLSLAPQEVTPPGEKKKTVHVLKLSANVTLAEAQRIAQLPVSRVLLPAPDESRPDLLLGPFPEDALLEKAGRPMPEVSEEEINSLWEDDFKPASQIPVIIEQPAPETAKTDKAFDPSAAPNIVTKAQLKTIADFRTLKWDYPKACQAAGYGSIVPTKLTSEQADYLIDQAQKEGFTA